MARELDPRRIEVIDDATASALRQLSGQESLRIAFDMIDFARDVLTASVRDGHPDWGEEQVAQEVARRFRGAAA